MIPQDVLTFIRTMFPHTALGKIYLNHAGTSPMSSKVLNVMSTYLIERSSGVIDNYANDVSKIAETRMLIRRLINADGTDRIAFTTNTSEGLNIVASGLAWKTGDRIVLSDLEFPANVYPYLHLRRHGVEIDFVKSRNGVVTPEMIEGAVNDRTRLLALSAVQFLSGFRADLETIGSMCRNRGIIFVVDGIQAIGAVRLDVQKMKIDALATGGQKWQMSPQGTGYLYLTRELQEQIQQAYLGWLAVEDPWRFFDFDQPLSASAHRYEGGTLNIPGLWGMHTALSTIIEYGPQEIEEHVLGLGRVLIAGLKELRGVTIYNPVEDSKRAGIVTIKLEDYIDTGNVHKMLVARNIITGLRHGLIRLSPHFYMTDEEMHATIKAIEECIIRSTRR